MQQPKRIASPRAEETEIRPCCDEPYCPREEISRFTDPDKPLSQRVRLIACRIADSCGPRPEETLRLCFSRLFDIPPECRMCDEFLDAYQMAEQALEAREEIKRSHTGASS